MNKKQLIISLALIVIVGLGAAWYFLIRNDTQEEQQPTNNTPTQTTPEATLESKADFEGEAVVSVNKKFSLTIPDGWKTVVNCTSSDLMYVSESDQSVLEYTAGTPPVIDERVCAGDGSLLFFVADNPKDTARPQIDGAEPFQTTSGLDGTKICEDNVASDGIAEETLLQRCTYQFESEDMVYTITYTRPDSSYADRVELIDRVVKSFVI